jgi:hypothetical protein
MLTTITISEKSILTNDGDYYHHTSIYSGNRDERRISLLTQGYIEIEPYVFKSINDARKDAIVIVIIREEAI